MRTLTPGRVCIAASLALLAGCATFHPLPLDNHRGPRHLANLEVPAASMPTPKLRAYTFDPANGLNVTEVAMLAVANNPALKVERDAADVAHAQAYAAGLLPDPTVSYAHQHPTRHLPIATTSFTKTLSLDLGNLVSRSARVSAAKAHVREVNLKLLWSEWQTIAKARTLFDHIYFLHKRIGRLECDHAALAPIQGAVTRALKAGDLTYDSASAGLNAASNVDNQLATAKRQLGLAEHNLHDLVGLDADVPLDLTGKPFSIDPTHREVQRALADMTKLRPDLLALQAGYRSQNEKLRAAILEQFPAITIGFARGRDNSDIHSAGFSIGLSLPIFNGNRGKVAIARATRKQLHDQYEARLLTDRNDVHRLFADLASDRAQAKLLAPHVAQLARARKAARVNYAAGRLGWPTYLAIRASALAADTSLLTVEENTHATTIALDALVGTWPDASEAGKNPEPSSAKNAKNVNKNQGIARDAFQTPPKARAAPSRKHPR